MKPNAATQPTVIAPSILSANFARLGEEVDNVLAAAMVTVRRLALAPDHQRQVGR